MFALVSKSVRSGDSVVAYFNSREMANKHLDRILDKRPWAIDFLRVVEVIR